MDSGLKKATATSFELRLADLRKTNILDTKALNNDNWIGTTCIFIPYDKFMSLPRQEINRARDEATIFKHKESLVSFIAEKYGIDLA